MKSAQIHPLKNAKSLLGVQAGHKASSVIPHASMVTRRQGEQKCFDLGQRPFCAIRFSPYL
jgi:hypothetical protein